MPAMLERLFHLKERGSTVAAELRGGAVMTATCLSAAFARAVALVTAYAVLPRLRH